jgi:hypothetical protein
MDRWLVVPLVSALLGVTLAVSGFAIQALDRQQDAQCQAGGGIACGIGTSFDAPLVAGLRAGGLGLLVAGAAVALWVWAKRPVPAQDAGAGESAKPGDPQS